MKVKPGKLFEKPKARIVREVETGSWPRRVWVEVDGMVCNVCAGRVREGLEGIEGVVRADVDLDLGEAVLITRREHKISEEDLQEAVKGRVILSWARGALSRVKPGPNDGPDR
jgi:copper chaperone CopZ